MPWAPESGGVLQVFGLGCSIAEVSIAAAGPTEVVLEPVCSLEVHVSTKGERVWPKASIVLTAQDDLWRDDGTILHSTQIELGATRIEGANISRQHGMTSFRASFSVWPDATALIVGIAPGVPFDVAVEDSPGQVLALRRGLVLAEHEWRVLEIELGP